MIHQVETQALILLLAACVIGMLARRARLPYTLALVLGGLILGFADLPALAGVSLNAELLLFLLLPALLFEAAFHIKWPDFRREAIHIFTLAIAGVLVATLATGALLYAGLGATGLVPGFGFAHAFIFATLIAATDPVSVLALFREVGVTRRLYLLVEGESLLNDGVAVVGFFIVLAIFGIEWAGHEAPALSGVSSIVSHALVEFVRMAVGGALVGLVIGGAFSALTRQLDDHLIETALTTLVAYGSFLLAEEFHCSGVLSTVCAGLVFGSVGAKHGMSPHTKRAVADFWEYAAFLANSFIFLLVGLRLDATALFLSGVAILVAFVSVSLARALGVYTLVPLANRFAQSPVPRKWKFVMVWGGLRGSLSMVLALSLPESFAGKQVLVNLVFGVVALSLFLQGLTIKPLLARLGMLKQHSTNSGYEVARAQAVAARRALHTAAELHADGTIGVATYERLKSYYHRGLERSKKLASERAGESELDEFLIEGLRRLAEVERDSLRHSAQSGIISDDSAAEVEANILLRLQEIERIEETGADAISAYLDARDAFDVGDKTDDEGSTP